MATARSLLVLLGRVGATILLAGVGLWTFGALWWASLPWPAARVALAVAFAASVVLGLASGHPRTAALLVVLVFLVALARFLALEPRRDADWTPNEARTAWTERAGDRVRIHNVRNTVYPADGEAEVRWETRSYDVSTLRRVWYLVVPFQEFRGGAHTFVSFEFDEDRFLAISVEARKERGETYGILEGLFRRFEVIYVIADERDLIGLRTHVRGDTGYLYPVRAPVEGVRAFFLEMLDTADALHRKPMFYNVLTNSCMTRLVGHLDDVRAQPLGWHLDVLLPALSDRLAHREGLIDTRLPFPQARERYRIDPARTSRDSPLFSLAIRGR